MAIFYAGMSLMVVGDEKNVQVNKQAVEIEGNGEGNW